MQVYLGLTRAALHMRVNRLMASPPKDVGVDTSLNQAGMQLAHNGTSRAVVETVNLHITQGSPEVPAESKDLNGEIVNCHFFSLGSHYRLFLHTILSTTPV